MVRRHQAAKFAADVFVFPGGTVRADDHLDPDEATTLGLDPGALHAALDAHQDPFGLEPDGGLSLWVAALRELFEEAGVLLAENAGGALADLSAPDRADHFQALRDRLQGGRLSLAELATATGIPRPTAFRLVTTLEQAGFVSKVSGEWTVGSKEKVSGGHQSNVDRPQETSRLIRDFLVQAPAAASTIGR